MSKTELYEMVSVPCRHCEFGVYHISTSQLFQTTADAWNSPLRMLTADGGWWQITKPHPWSPLPPLCFLLCKLSLPCKTEMCQGSKYLQPKLFWSNTVSVLFLWQPLPVNLHQPSWLLPKIELQREILGQRIFQEWPHQLTLNYKRLSQEALPQHQVSPS